MRTDNTKRKRVTIGVDDVYRVFQRYTEHTIITLYQEIAEFCDEKIEWKELVKRTSTGIKNAREYQMLWRHLAYRHSLEDKIEDGAEPLDDESDLETDLEATPPESAKMLADAQACVKVLLASGPPINSSMANSLAATSSLDANENLTSAVPKISHDAVSQPGTNSSLHVSSPKRQSSNDLAAIGGNPLSKKKKKMWSSEDDMVLIAGVKKCGLGNWATISREFFNGERNAAQIGSRWKLLKDKNYPGSNSAGPNVNGQQLSNELVTVATRNAISMALKMPTTVTASSAGTRSSRQLAQAVSSVPLIDGASSTKTIVPVKSSISSHSALQATAMAAGARISTLEAAEYLLKAAHANNAVHIMNGGGSIKTASFSPLPTPHLVAPHRGGSGLAATTPSNSSVVERSVLKACPPLPVIANKAGDKPEMITGKKAVNNTCNDSTEERNQQAHDYLSVAEKPGGNHHQNSMETGPLSLPSESGKEKHNMSSSLEV